MQDLWNHPTNSVSTYRPSLGQGVALCLLFGAIAMAPVRADDQTDVMKKDAKARYEQSEEHAEADRAAAKAQCKSLEGDARKACLQDAKSAEKKAKADAKAARKSDIAKAHADEEGREADYKAAKVRCGSLSGDAKDACIADARVKYGQ